MNIVKLNSRYQVTVPEFVIKDLHFTPGDTIYFIICENRFGVISKEKFEDEFTISASKFNTACKVTIPKEIRKQLKLTSGDYIFFSIYQEGCAILKKTEPIDYAYYAGLWTQLTEWHGDTDDALIKET